MVWQPAIADRLLIDTVRNGVYVKRMSCVLLAIEEILRQWSIAAEPVFVALGFDSCRGRFAELLL